MGKPVAVPIAAAAITAAGSIANTVIQAKMAPKPPKPPEQKVSMPGTAVGQVNAMSRTGSGPLFAGRSQLSSSGGRSSLAQSLLNS